MQAKQKQVPRRSKYSTAQEDCSPLQDPQGFIPAGYNYFKVTVEVVQRDLVTCTIPFPNYNVPFDELMGEFLSRKPIYGIYYKLKEFAVTINSDFIEDLSSTLENIRRKLKVQSLSGKSILLTQDQIFAEENNCNFSVPQNLQSIQFKVNQQFLLLNNQQIFFLSLDFDLNQVQLHNQIIKYMLEFYGVKINPSQLGFYSLQKGKVKPGSKAELQELQWSTVCEMTVEDAINTVRSREKQIIGVAVFRQDIKFPSHKVSGSKSLIVVIDKDTKICLKLDQIKDYKVYQLLRFLDIQQYEHFGLKIIDQIFRPYQSVGQIQECSYFGEGPGKYFKNIECRLVSEKQMFYEDLFRRYSEDFQITRDRVTQQGLVQLDRCLNRLEEVRKEESVVSLGSDVGPITYYTSSMQVQSNGTSFFLYSGINRCLRQTNAAMLRQATEQQRWKYLFTASLVKSLSQLSNYRAGTKTTVYRAVKYHKMVGEVGEIYEEKNFCSTTRLRDKAIDIMNRVQKQGTFLEIECLTGKYVGEFSMYKSEEEVLFRPYTRFMITHRQQMGSFVEMRLRQMPQERYSSNHATVILWVDDKLKEGDSVIQTLDCEMHTTLLYQLQSNLDLRDWIDANQGIIQNRNMKIAVISNMRRWQAPNRQSPAVEVKDAGAQTVKIVHQMLPRAEMIMYIRHIQGTRQALLDNGINVKNVQIYNKRSELRAFIAEVARPYEDQDQFESWVERQKKSMLSFFNRSGSGKKQPPKTARTEEGI